MSFAKKLRDLPGLSHMRLVALIALSSTVKLGDPHAEVRDGRALH